MRTGMCLKLLVASLGVGLSGLVSAGVCDLTVVNSTCTFSTDSTSGAAIYSNPDNVINVGSGVIYPFLTTQVQPANDSVDNSESGYSTDAASLPLDDKRSGGNEFTRTFSLSQLGIVTTATGVYFQFFLDVNEPNGDKSILYLDYLKIFNTNQTTDVLLNTSDLSAPDNQSGWDLLYNLDAADSTNSLKMDYDIFNGSGNGFDLSVLIPVSYFSGVGLDERIVFANAFSSVGDGFEEWSYFNNKEQEHVCPPGTVGTYPFCRLPPVTIPEPGTLALIGLSLAGLAATRRKRNC